MRRALAGLGVVGVLVTGCASISPSDEEACDFLGSNRGAARDGDEADVEARQRIIDEFGGDGAVEALTEELHFYFGRVVEDARREASGREARYFDAHLNDALSACMDVGW